jgi:hypothetical protein
MPTKDSILLDDLRLIGNANFHIWKYMMTRATKKEKLFRYLEPPASSSKGKTDIDPDEEQNKEDLLYMMTRSTKPGAISNLTDYEDPSTL